MFHYMRPHILTLVRRFLHTTWLGAAIVHCFWQALAAYSVKRYFQLPPWETFSRIPFDISPQFYVLGVSWESPLRRTHSLFWNTRTNDEGIPREGSFHTLAVSGKISLVAPARMAKFGDDGHSVILEDGRVFPAAAVVLATGYESTWRSMFDGECVVQT